MPRLILLCSLSFALLLGACTTPPRPDALPSQLFDDDAFAPPSVRIDASEVMAMSPRMKEHLQAHVLPRLRWQSLHDGLVNALYTRSKLGLRYDTEMTRTAAEAFDARAGNCLSLVLMTASFARELRLPYRFQAVEVDETWARDGDLLLFVGHVNIALGHGSPGVRVGAPGGDWMTVDFLPSADLRRQRMRPIDEATVLAMYMNNKSAEALAQGRIDDAYAWARAAIEQDRGFPNAYNTLGVVYLRHRQPDRAEAALRFALTLEPDNPHVLNNLASALRQQGREAEAQAVALQLQRIQPTTPFAHFELGEKALREGDARLARRHFEQALRRGGDYHEFHYALAQALVRLGEFAQAAHELELARSTSGTERLQSMYADKLERLRGQLMQ